MAFGSQALASTKHDGPPVLEPLEPPLDDAPEEEAVEPPPVVPLPVLAALVDPEVVAELPEAVVLDKVAEPDEALPLVELEVEPEVELVVVEAVAELDAEELPVEDAADEVPLPDVEPAPPELDVPREVEPLEVEAPWPEVAVDEPVVADVDAAWLPDVLVDAPSDVVAPPDDPFDAPQATTSEKRRTDAPSRRDRWATMRILSGIPPSSCI